MLLLQELELCSQPLSFDVAVLPTTYKQQSAVVFSHQAFSLMIYFQVSAE
jgi:hypothetical protein